MLPPLAACLQQWRQKCPYNQEEDLAVASLDKQGKQPLWPSSAMSKHVRPASVRAGIKKHVRWHIFRHWMGSTMAENGEGAKTMQDSLRHTDAAISLELYAQASRASKQGAQAKLIDSILPNVPICSQM